MNSWIEWVGIAGSVALPLFNIPLIMHVIKRKSSDDYSLSWAIGVWSCIVLMTPQALRSPDPTFKIFGIFNLVFFSLVVFFILKYRSKPQNQGDPS